MAIYLTDNAVLLDSGRVAISEDCCCGLNCNVILSFITFSGVTLPGCCVSVPFGPSTINVPCTPSITCYDINQSWLLTYDNVSVPPRWNFGAGAATAVAFQSFYDDEFCSIFDSSGDIPWSGAVFCSDGSPVYGGLPAGWYVTASQVFESVGITNPFVPVNNVLTCNGADFFGVPAMGESGTAVLS